ncbi:PREDICTED: uncharacterized protein LOC105359256 [Ceratosolen solmsi marchali]|uniref:Uncharacterized protein LOC105359256 n=1 Tax=Ceratosolen solmsi marchali TaxID=326594 RepID=A0AAJ6VK72_9HYME|nr:PREDICTED: uncharacterized protein LOC105359256 [Ceratosolen solmsi marchali]
MDVQIMKNILSSGNMTIEALDEHQNPDFPPIRYNVIHELSKILTKYLSYKVSQEAYQRYSVRLHLIDTLRDWSQIKGGIDDLRFFKDNQRSYNFLIRFLKKYLSEEIIGYCDDADGLVQLAEILFNALMQKRSLTKCFTRVMERIIKLDETEKSQKFLRYIISKSDEFKLDSALINNIYLNKKLQFIEKPLGDSFMAYCSDRNKEHLLSNMDSLFEYVIDSPQLFQTVSGKLKEFFIETKYSEVARDFIQCVLDKIEINCAKNKKDLLDLYPTHLQFCVILLRIKQHVHRENSRIQTVESLKEIFLNDHDDAITLVSHFPEWLPDYLAFFEA